MNYIDTMRQALDALSVYASKAEHKRNYADDCSARQAMKALQEAITQAEKQKPVKQYRGRFAGLVEALSGQPAAQQAPEDFSVSMVLRDMGGFAGVSTAGVTVTHKPTGLSVTETEARSQHVNRGVAFEKLKTLIADTSATVPSFNGPATRKLADLQAQGWQVNGVHIQRQDGDAWKHGAVAAQGLVLWWQSEQARVPLTDEQIDEIYGANCGDGGPTAICKEFARAIEAAHNIK